MHPLIDSLSNLSDEELGKRIIKMNRILSQCSYNYQLYEQAQLVMNQLLTEQGDRAERKFQKFLEANDNNKLTEIININ